jgi:hypothetical protein
VSKDKASLSPWPGSREGGKETTILLLRLQYEKEKIRCEIKPVTVRCDDQRVGAVVLVINAAREQACLGKTTVLKAAGRKSLLSHKDYPPLSNPLRGGKCSPQATPGYPYVVKAFLAN